MNYINNPSKTAGFFSISMAPIVALATERSKVFVATQPLATSSSLVMNILALFIFATFANWVEGNIRLLCLGILIVFTLALGGCIPQPSAALEALRSFQGSF